MKWSTLAAVATMLISASAQAAETVTYSYDALGRLVGTAHSGSINDGRQSTIAYDAAGNRSNYSVNVPAPVLAISNALVTEGGNLVFTVTRSGDTSGAVSVNWASADGTATAGSDYTAGAGAVSFAAGQTSVTITVATIDDTIVEPSETMTVTLSAPTGGATLSTATGAGTILDNDASSFAIGNASATEGGNLVFTVTKSGGTAAATSVNWATASGTATSGSDFTTGSGALNFAVGQATATITVATTDDTLVESTEAMAVTLSAPTSGATLTTATGTGTILDNDVAPTLAIGNASATEGGSLSFTVTRSGNTTGASSVNWATANGTALAGSDYVAGSGTLSFAAGETSKAITVSTIDDTVTESTETMAVNLTAPSSATISTATGTGTILDNDSGWSSSMTAGSLAASCSQFGCYFQGGYKSGVGGSMTNTAWTNYTITGLFSATSGGPAIIYLTMNGTTAPPNSGWTSITISNVGTFNRSAASYSVSGTTAQWSWSGPMFDATVYAIAIQ